MKRHHPYNFDGGPPDSSYPFPPLNEVTEEGQKFYIIWNPLSMKPPRIKFTDRANAERIADQMARRFHEPFYVLRALSKYEVPKPVVRTVLK